jgi:hypothetical protein
MITRSGGGRSPSRPNSQAALCRTNCGSMSSGTGTNCPASSCAQYSTFAFVSNCGVFNTARQGRWALTHELPCSVREFQPVSQHCLSLCLEPAVPRSFAFTRPKQQAQGASTGLKCRSHNSLRSPFAQMQPIRGTLPRSVSGIIAQITARAHRCRKRRIRRSIESLRYHDTVSDAALPNKVTPKNLESLERERNSSQLSTNSRMRIEYLRHSR